MNEETEKSKIWTSRWQEKLLLSRDKHDYIMLTDAEYKDEDNLDNGDVNPYWVGSFYNVKNNTGGFRQWRNDGDPSSTLFIRHEEGDPRLGFGPKNQFFFNVIHFDTYKKQVVKDRQGKVIIAKNGPNAGEPLQSFRPVTNIRDRKQLAKSPDEDTVFFRKKYMQVGPTHYDNLLTILDKARELCHCSGQLDIVNYECEHCGAHMLDMDNSDLTVADVNRFGDGIKRCSSCRQRGYPIPVLECDNCDDPRPHRFDQVIAKVKKSGNGPQTIIQVDDVISALDFTLDSKEPIVERDDQGAPVIDDGHFMYTDELAYVTQVSWDFDKGNPAPGNGEVSSFLGLNPEEEGYSTEASSYSKTKKAVSRRRFR